MVFRLYFAAPIDVCVKKALAQIVEFKKIFEKYPIEVHGAGFGDSPIIPSNCTKEYKGIITAYDLRKIRECDILLVVTDLKTFCAGTMMELEYARNLGIFTMVLCLSKDKVKNIFIETMTNRIIYTIEELEDVLKEITK